MFRLDKVLRYKERLERESRVRRATAERALDELLVAAARLRAERANLPDVAGADFETLVGWANYAEGLRRREARIDLRITEFRPKVAEAVAEHLMIRREVEGLRKLKERTRVRQRKRRERGAQQAMDDVASRSFLPGSGTEFPPPEPEADGWRAREDAEKAQEVEMGPKRETEA